MKITAINSDNYTTKSMTTKVTSTFPFGGFRRPCQPVNPDVAGETPAPNPGFKGNSVKPTDEPKTGTLNILA